MVVIVVPTNFLQTKIGIIGGGQLGQMMILEAKKMGFYVIVLDPTPDCPAHSICDEHIIADFKMLLHSLLKRQMLLHMNLNISMQMPF